MKFPPDREFGWIRALFELHEANKAAFKLERVTKLPILIFLILCHVEDGDHVPVGHKHIH